MTKRQRIDAARETRLWISTIVTPLASVAAAAISVPEVRQEITHRYKKAKTYIQSKIKRDR